eukprot:gene5421-7510_t
MLSILKKNLVERKISNNSQSCLKQLRSIFTLDVSKEVQNALSKNAPVVALESTIISHGMPYPQNLQVAKQVEEKVRSNGAIPATIAVVNGIIKIGLNDEELHTLANNNHDSNDNHVLKASTRDIAYAIVNKKSAATTVASTMRLAHAAGINVFATGGIGGVHRDVEKIFDISADLFELSRTPVMVVCAGIKSILDIPKSLEVLESYSVPVIGYQTEQFPGFFTNNTGIKAPKTASNTIDIANMMYVNQLLNISSGMVIGVPNPSPYQNDEKNIDDIINEALTSIKVERITGADVTPYLLSKIQLMTNGKSLNSNINLILNNAKVASLLAIDYCNIIESNKNNNKTYDFYSKTSQQNTMFNISIKNNNETIPNSTIKQAENNNHSNISISTTKDAEVVVVGGAVVDMIGQVTHNITKINSSNIGVINTTCGGVGRNIAEFIAKINNKNNKGEIGNDNISNIVTLATVVCDDSSGLNIVKNAADLGINTSLIKTISTENFDDNNNNNNNNKSTAIYNAIHDNQGNLCIGIADMSIFKEINPHYIKSLANSISKSRIVVVDGNIPIDSFVTLTNICKHYNIPVFFEPTSDHKCLLPFLAESIEKVDIIKPNVSELIEIVSYCLTNNMLQTGKSSVQHTLSNITANRSDPKYLDSINMVDIRILSTYLLKIMNQFSYKKIENKIIDNQQQLQVNNRLVNGKHVIVSLGARDDSQHIVIQSDDELVALRYIPAIFINSKILEKNHTNGAGDSFCAGLISKMIEKEKINKSYLKDNHNITSDFLPDLDCIMSGLKSSYDHITKSK